MLKGEALLAYTAGIIDGEGCITLANYAGVYKGQRSKSVKYRIYVMVTNTNISLIDFLKINFGGSVSVLAPRGKCKPAWNWHISSKKAAELLLALRPYLLLKIPQAELALAFDARRHNGTRGLENAKRQALDQADKILMLSLNKRGVEIPADSEGCDKEESHGL